MTFKNILLQFGKYILAVVILFLALVFKGDDMAISRIRSSYDWLSFILLLGIPIVSVVSNSYVKGLAYMFLTTACINFVLPQFDVSSGSPLPFGLGKENSGSSSTYTSDDSESIDGTYSGDIGGATSTLRINGGSWYGENRESSAGGLLGSASGTMDGNDLINDYGEKIGYVNGRTANVTMGGDRVRLTKE